MDVVATGQNPLQRILVTGNAGAGKTTLARALATKMGLPYCGLDSIVWQAGWVKTPNAEREQKESAILATPAWIIDGVSFKAVDAADLVIFLDYPRRTCMWRACWRNLPYLFRSRPGLPAQCPEIEIIPTLLKIIWRFPQQIRPKLLAACIGEQKGFVHIRNNDDLSRFLATAVAPALTYSLLRPLHIAA